MNSRFEINKRKEYQEGLLAAFNVSLPDEFRSDMKELMADVLPKVKGRADGKAVSDAAKALLGK